MKNQGPAEKRLRDSERWRNLCDALAEDAISAEPPEQASRQLEAAAFLNQARKVLLEKMKDRYKQPKDNRAPQRTAKVEPLSKRMLIEISELEKPLVKPKYAQKRNPSKQDNRKDTAL